MALRSMQPWRVILAVSCVVSLLSARTAWTINDYPDWGDTPRGCAKIGHVVVVDGPDPYGLDTDGDGLGCEELGNMPQRAFGAIAVLSLLIGTGLALSVRRQGLAAISLPRAPEQ